MNKILRKLVIAGILVGVCSVAYARSAQKVFDGETVGAAAPGDVSEVATSTGYNISGATSIGFAFRAIQGTSTPHVSLGYQTSMNNSSWTATTEVVTDTSVVAYTATGTAVTIPPTDWIRWILSNEVDNAVDTTFDLWFTTKNEGGK